MYCKKNSILSRMIKPHALLCLLNMLCAVLALSLLCILQTCLAICEEDSVNKLLTLRWRLRKMTFKSNNCFSTGSNAGNNTLPGDFSNRPNHVGHGSARHSGGKKYLLILCVFVWIFESMCLRVYTALRI